MITQCVSSPPAIMAPRRDGFEVVWAVTRLCRGWVELKLASGKVFSLHSDAWGLVPQDNEVLRVRVDGLEPGQEVQIRTVTEAVNFPPARHESEWKMVRTLDPAAAAVHFGVWNDTHQNTTTLSRLDDQTPKVDVLFWNGDLCNDWITPGRFGSTILAPAGRDITAGRPVHVAVGNHDVRGRYAYKLAQFIATAEGRPYTAFRSGPVAFVVLHTGEDKPDNHPTFKGRVALEVLRERQARWLAEVTVRPEIAEAPFKVVICHIPLRWKDEEPVDYDKGGYDSFSLMSRDQWHDALVAWGAQVVISGHMHEAAWLPPSEEFPYAQLVSGGPESNPKNMEAAMWVEGTADAESLNLVLRDLTGRVIHDQSFAPQAKI